MKNPYRPYNARLGTLRTAMSPHPTISDYDYDRTDALEDEALARLRDADAWSDTETEDERFTQISASISLATSTTIPR